MKEILYYTLVREWQHSPKMKVMGVTSEGPRGRVNGRWSDNFPTHTTSDLCVGKFTTQADANALIERIKKITKDYEGYRKPLEDGLREFHNKERAEIDKLLKDNKCLPI